MEQSRTLQRVASVTMGFPLDYGRIDPLDAARGSRAAQSNLMKTQVHTLISCWSACFGLTLAACFQSCTAAPQVPERLDLAFPFAKRVAFRTPHVAVRCEASVKPKERQVQLVFRYRADGHFRSTEQVEACTFRPTAVAQRSASQILVAGKTDDGALVLEEWTLRHPTATPMPITDAQTGQVHDPEYRATVTARTKRWSFASTAPTEAVEWMQFVRGGTGALVLVKLYEADDLLCVDLGAGQSAGQSTVLFEGDDVTAQNFVSALSAPWNTLSVYRHAQHGDIYVLQRVDRASADPRVALVFEDSDRDGALDGWRDFTDHQDFDGYLGAEQGLILEFYNG